jgi:adenylate cyclase
MLSFRIAITGAVIAFIAVLAACLIVIQIVTFDASAKAAASAGMDAASANTLGRLEADVAALSSLVRILAIHPSLAEVDEDSEFDGIVALFKAALREQPQTDSIHVGFENGRWLQARRLAVLDRSERRRLEAPDGAAYNINLTRPGVDGALSMNAYSRTSTVKRFQSLIFRITATTRVIETGTGIRSAQTSPQFRRRIGLSASPRR